LLRFLNIRISIRSVSSANEPFLVHADSGRNVTSGETRKYLRRFTRFYCQNAQVKLPDDFWWTNKGARAVSSSISIIFQALASKVQLNEHSNKTAVKHYLTPQELFGLQLENTRLVFVGMAEKYPTDKVPKYIRTWMTLKRKNVRSVASESYQRLLVDPIDDII
jgi:hypothetical protein